MNVGETVRFAWQGVTANKARSSLTMLGVLIGVASVIALVAVGNGASASVSNTLTSLGSNTLTVVPGTSTTAEIAPPNPFGGDDGADTGSDDETGTGGAEAVSTTDLGGTDIRGPQLSLDDARALADPAQAPDVLGVAPLVSPQGVTASYRGTSVTVGTLTGTTPGYLLINDDTVSAGYEFSDSDYLAHSRVALVGMTVAEDLAGGDGAALLNQQISLNGHAFTVIGLLTTKGSTGPQDNDDRILAPATAVQDTLAGYTDLSSIAVKARSAETVDAAQSQVERILDARHGTTPATRDFSVTSSASILEAAGAITAVFTLLLAAIAAISLVVGGIGVMNIMLVTVTERTREIGIRKAIGAGKADIVAQFLLEAVMLSMFGGLLGVVLGSLTGLVRVDTFTPVVSVSSIALAFSFSIAVGLFFGLYPANRAAALKPIDALRYE